MPEFREMGRAILVRGFSALKERMLTMITDPAEPRHLQRLQKNPEIVMQAPLKTIASYLNQTQLDSLDPEQYTDVEPLQFDLYVDVLSSQLTRVVYADQAQTSEYYRAYGLRDTQPLPVNPIPLTELQKRLQELQ